MKECSEPTASSFNFSDYELSPFIDHILQSIEERDFLFIFEKLYLLGIIKRKNKDKRRGRKFPLLLSIPHITFSQLLYLKIQSVSYDNILDMFFKSLSSIFLVLKK